MRGEVKSDSIKIDRLRTKIFEGEIKIPPFQREFVWEEEQVIELLDSIYNDFPVGSVLLWETYDKLPARREIGGFNLPETNTELPLSYVLDGQQRITSIFGAFCNEDITQSNEDMASKFDIVFDMNSKSFKMSQEVEENDLVIPLKIIFDNYQFNHYLHSDSRFNQEKSKEAARIQSIFQNYELPTVTIRKKDKGDVGTIFERINNTGTPLSPLDLLTAWTWSDEYYLKEVFANIYDLLETKSFENFKDKLLLQCFSAVISESTKTRDMLSLNAEDVRTQTPVVINSMKKAIDLLFSQFNVKTDEFLPKPQQFVGLVYLFSKINILSAEQLDVVGTWFWRTSFSNRYSAGTDQKMNDDISFFKDIINNKFDGLQKYRSDLSEDIFLKKTLAKSNSWSRATLLLMADNNPKDLTNGGSVDVGLALSTFNRKEYHHIFPRNFLKQNFNLETSEINKLANFCFLPAASNKLISDKAPSDYFSTVIPQNQLNDILKSNFLPLDADIYQNDNYTQFASERAQLLFDAAKEKINEKYKTHE